MAPDPGITPESLTEEFRRSIEQARTGGIQQIIDGFNTLNQVQKPASATAMAYDGKLPFQQAAAAEMATKADFISTWLFTIAKANVDYAVKMGEYVRCWPNTEPLIKIELDRTSATTRVPCDPIPARGSG